MNDMKAKATSKEKIARSFVTLLADTSIENLTIRDICVKAGVSRSTFYVNFSNIADIAKFIEEKNIKYSKEYISEHVQPLLDADVVTNSEIRNCFEEFLVLVKKHPSHLLLWDKLEKFNKFPILEAQLKVIEKIISQNNNKEKTAVLLPLIICTIKNAIYTWVSENFQTDIDTLADYLTAIVNLKI